MPFDLTTTTREIEQRNQLRRDVGLPLLDRDVELEKARNLHQQRDFQDYIDQHRELYGRTLWRAASNYQRRTGMVPRGVVAGFAVGAGVMRMFRRRWIAGIQLMAKKTYTWEIFWAQGQTLIVVGTVEAPDRQSAIHKAIKELDIPPNDQKRLMAVRSGR